MKKMSYDEEGNEFDEIKPNWFYNRNALEVV